MMVGNSPAPRRFVALTAGIAALSAAWYLAYRTVGAGPVWIAYLGLPAGSAVSAAAVALLLRRMPLAPRARQFWRLILVLELSMAMGYTIQAANAIGDHPAEAGRILPALLCTLVGLVAAGVAIARVPVGMPTGAERRKLWLDRLIAFLGCSTVLWQFGLAPMLTTSGLWPVSAKVLVALASLLGALGLTKVAYVAGGPVDRVAVRLVASTGLVGAVFAVIAAHAGHRTTGPAEALFTPIAPALIALAVRRQWTSTGPRRPQATWLPYVAIAAVAVPLLAAIAGEMRWTGRVVAVAAVTVAVLVAIRQRVVEQRLAFEAGHDGLTGLANRSRFRKRLALALETRPATVLLVNLDNFKAVNESLGHEVGDDVLTAVAAALKGAADPGLCARLSGDEFAVLLTDPAVPAETVVERIMTALGDPLGECGLLMHASAGIADAPAGTPVDQLLRDADAALYAAKQRGKANWVRFAPGLERPVVADAQIGAELRLGLEAGEFHVVYQPIVDLARERIVGVEALVRWQHPERGVVPPIEFIPVAERTGLIVPLGRFVLRETCRQAAQWLAEFGPGLKSGANVSVRQLHDPDFANDVRAVLAETGLPPHQLVLELTESAVLRGHQASLMLHELHGLGVRLALDDFGTGESSLSLLRSFPASIIKLDKSFVDGIELDEPGTPAAGARQAVARAVAQLAGALDLETVAEGIENASQAERLRRLGYVQGQGYHFARPMPAAEVTRLLDSQQRVLDRAS